MVNKKGFMRTLEATIAVVLTFTILFALLPKIQTGDSTPDIGILEELQYDAEFRNCALDRNFSCVNETVHDSLPVFYRDGYIVNLTNNENYIPDLPLDRNVKSESVFISGNLTLFDPIIVKLFYWA